MCIASSYGKDQFQFVDLKYGMEKMEKSTKRIVCIKFEEIFFVIIRMPINKQMTISHVVRLLSEHDKIRVVG